MSGNSGNTMGEKETAEKSLRCLRDQTQTATPSTSRDLHAAAADIVGKVIASMDELVESRMTDGRRDSVTSIVQSLDDFSSSSSAPSESSSDVQDASDSLAEAVIDNLARYLEAVRSEMEDQDRRLENIFRLADTSLPRDQMTAARIRSSSAFFVFTRMKYMLKDHLRRAGEQRSDFNSFSETTVYRRPTTSSSSPPYPESETTSHHEDDIISDSGTVTITPSQSQKELSQSPGPSHASPNNAGSVIEMETQEAGTCPSVPVEKSSRGFFCIFGKRAGMVRFRQKTCKVCPLGETENSKAGNRQESTVTSLKKMRKRMSRMFATMRKALPNPFTCLTPS